MPSKKELMTSDATEKKISPSKRISKNLKISKKELPVSSETGKELLPREEGDHTVEHDEQLIFKEQEAMAATAKLNHESMQASTTLFETCASEIERQNDSKQKSKPLTLHLSSSLLRKLERKAQSEGVSLEELAQELVAEGLVLRVWEIMEKKTAMKGVPQGGGVPQNLRNNNQNRVGFRNQNYSKPRNGFHESNGHGNGGHHHNNSQNNSYGRQNYKNIMDDNANFLDYVRNQEKKQK